MLNNKGENDTKKWVLINDQIWIDAITRICEVFFVKKFQQPTEIYVTKSKTTAKFPCLKWSKLVVQTDV